MKAPALPSRLLAIVVSLAASASASTLQLPTGASESGKVAAVAVSGQFVAIGRPADSTVDVYDAVKNKLIRSLTVGVAADEYGRSVALRGREVIVGAPGMNSNDGVVFIHDALTGAILRSFTYTGGGRFGYCVACDGDEMVIGAPTSINGVPGGFDRGKAYRINLPVGKPSATIQLTELLPVTEENDAFFGQSVAIHGDVIAVGAPFYDTSAIVNSGKVYLFDAKQQPVLPNAFINEINSYSNTVIAANDNYGWSVALSPTHLIASAPFSNALAGNVTIDEYRSGGRLNLNVGPAGSHYGYSLAVSEKHLLIGSPGANSNDGLTFVYEEPTSALNYSLISILSPPYVGRAMRYGQGVATFLNFAAITTVTPFNDSDFTIVTDELSLPRTGLTESHLHEELRTGSSPAPSMAVIKQIKQAGISPYTGSFFGQALTAAQLANNTMTLIYGDSSALATHSNAISIFDPVSNADEAAGGSVGWMARLNNQNWFLISTFLSNSSTIGLQPGQFINASISYKSYQSPRYSRSNALQQNFGVTATFQTTVGAPTPVNASTDSGIVIADLTMAPTLIYREGSPGPLGNFGQFAPRFSFEASNLIFTSAVQGAPTVSDTALFTHSMGAATIATQAQENDLAPGTGGARYSAFVGESANGFGNHEEYVFRATLRNSPATGNEALFARRNGALAPALLLRKGDPLTVAPSLKVNRFHRYWIESSGRVLVLAGLSGSGVNAANDTALIAVDLSGSQELLLREGSQAPGLNGARIGTIQFVDGRVEGNTWTALVTLVNQAGVVTPADNLAVFVGTSQGAVPALSQPRLALRKGSRIDQPGAEIIKSIALSSKVTDGTSGALGVGLGHVVSPKGNISTILTFTDGLQTSTTITP